MAVRKPSTGHVTRYIVNSSVSAITLQGCIFNLDIMWGDSESASLKYGRRCHAISGKPIFKDFGKFLG
jgi:hypothetical protein